MKAVNTVVIVTHNEDITTVTDCLIIGCMDCCDRLAKTFVVTRLL